MEVLVVEDSLVYRTFVDLQPGSVGVFFYSREERKRGVGGLAESRLPKVNPFGLSAARDRE